MVQLPTELSFFSELLGRRRREQERLLTEQFSPIAIARLDAMFETPIPVPALADIPAAVAVEANGQALSVHRDRVSSKKAAKASRPMKACPDCLESVVKTSRSCPFCRYDFVLAVSGWSAEGRLTDESDARVAVAG